MNVQIEEGWKKALAPEFEKDYFCLLYTSPSPRDTR